MPEITEIHANAAPTGATQIEIVLWSEESGLVAIAGSVTLDGHRIEG